ncbi:MAG: hypothetical protein ACI867_001385, partial [Glaciecola sp.]
DEGWFPEDIEIGGWISFSTDADSDNPTFTTVEATGSDPLMRGDACNHSNRCGVIVDFIGSTITPDGRVFGAVIDGCREECTAQDGDDVSGSGKGQGQVITIPGLDLCAATCPRFPVGSGEAIDEANAQTR